MGIDHHCRKTHVKFQTNNFLSFDGTNFKSEARSKFYHAYVSILGSYRDSPFVTGHFSFTEGLKTEILDYESGEWKQAVDYPFSNGDRYVLRLSSEINQTEMSSNTGSYSECKYLYK